MTPIPHQSLVRQLEWRYAVQKFDPARRIAPADWDALERALVLTPSSFGLQPWKFVVVERPEIRAQLLAASWNQGQVADASHMVVFAIEKDAGAPLADRYLARIAAVRGVPLESLGGFRNVLVRFLGQPAERFNVNEWSARQVYIALGSFMTSAAMLGIDTCPMEGIAPARYDEILGLPALGLAAVVVCCAGYRAADDPDATAKKVRYEHGDVVLRV